MECIVCDGRGCEFCPRVRPDGTVRAYHGYVDEADVIGEEYGFELHLTDEHGNVHVFNLQRVAASFYDKMRKTIGPWLDEAEEARATMPPRDDEEPTPVYAWEAD